MAGSEGTAFGKYFLMKKIAAGGMGEIFLAKLKGPVGFEKLLVIKRILQHHVENEEFLDMFFAEARVAAQLTHSNIVQIYEMGEIEDAYFIGMEYVHGKSLRDIIDRARQLGEYIPPAHCVEIISKLCAGLSFAHNAKDMSGDSLGIIHRDINPHNMLVSYGGDVKVIDFGIAKSEMSMHKTETGTIKGKFVYMSPEQSAAEKLDKRSDLFAVGICLYEALTFVNPFAKANVVLSLDAIQRKDPQPPSETSHKLAAFDPIVRKSLAKKAEDRYDDCLNMRDDLQQLLTSGAVPPAHQSLSAYMHDLFEEQIEQEKRMIVETDTSNTSQLESMKAARMADSTGASGRHKAHPRRRTSEPDLEDFDDADFDDITANDEVAAHSASVDVIDEDEPHSRLPFIAILALILVGSLIGSFAMVKTGPPVTVLAMAPVPENAGSAAGRSGAGTGPARIGAMPESVAPSGGATQESSPPATTKVEKGPRSHSSESSKRSKKDRGKSALDRAKELKDKGKKDDRSAKEDRGAKPDKPKKEEPPPPPPPAAEPGFGNVFISTTPPVKITHKGRAGQTFKLKSTTGIIIFGSVADKAKFHVKVSYRVKDGDIVYTSVTSEPWAIVKSKGGIGLGKTPLTNVKGGTSTLLEMLNPKAGLRLRITLRYSPP